MFTKTMIALCASAVLATAVASAAEAQTNTQEWWRAYELDSNGVAKRCIRGDESATSAYPSWMVC